MVQGGTDRRGCRLGVIVDGVSEVDPLAWQIVFEIADGGWPNLGPQLE
jgi:hypothetical protein